MPWPRIRWANEAGPTEADMLREQVAVLKARVGDAIYVCDAALREGRTDRANVLLEIRRSLTGGSRG